ncbi:LysM peptidoglycan-binding domain-containing protein [Methylobacterium sp. GC_Met_2]|uniref:LysM peptidoglycan-binding domain-containing protein n=1 Tax=Methylobacterium sp. GC_Met_2 TaxID=2937376 RepID=UPI00226B7F88|nr:LysM peptidoglycan-binding domain-containing protein [Methylobacterium sp. GC_Met_2]
MMAALRRILVTAFIAALAGLGVITALLSRRPRRALSAGADTASARLRGPRHRFGAVLDRNAIGHGSKRIATEAVLTKAAAAPSSAVRMTGGRGLTAGLVAVLLLLTGLAGLVYERRDALLDAGSATLSDAAKSLAALSPPAAGSARAPASAADMPAGSVRTTGPGTPAGLPSAPMPASAVPDFDVVRVEPNGEAVIAGRAAPNAAVALLVDGKPVAQVRADAGGQFTILPPPLPTGSSEIALRAMDSRGDTQRSAARIAVLVAPSRDVKPLVALMEPDKPTRVLSRSDGSVATGPIPAIAAGRQALRAEGEATAKQNPPAMHRDASTLTPAPRGSDIDTSRAGTGRADGQRASDPAHPPQDPHRAEASADRAATPPTVASIDAQDGGKLLVTARGAPGAHLRLYLSGTLIAPATVGRDGTVTFAIGQGVKPGDYRVRLDWVDPATGKVRDRAEVPFKAPGPGHDRGVEYAAAQHGSAYQAAGQGIAEQRTSGDAIPPSAHPADQVRPPTTGSLAANGPSGTGSTSAIDVPRIGTVRIERGDSLWRISRRAYGEGVRYTLIFDANHKQIQDPDLIYPGQVFVLPPEHDGKGGADTQPR